MTLQEKLEVLEDVLELDEGTLNVEDSLEDIEEWDSMSKLYLVTYVKKEMKKRLTVDEIKNFKTVQDICDYLE
jgi:acyl carrier protein